MFEFHSEAIFELNGKKFNVKPGDWFIVKAEDEHYIEALPNKFARFIPIRFPYSHTDKYYPEGKQVIEEK